MNEPTFDAVGYPTDETLKAIRDWKIETEADCVSLLKFVAAAWRHSHAEETSPGLWTFATGGWSGNESLMEQLMENYIFNPVVPSLHIAGGLHIFAVSSEAKAKMREFDQIITKWAWSGGKL